MSRKSIHMPEDKFFPFRKSKENYQQFKNVYNLSDADYIDILRLNMDKAIEYSKQKD